MARQALAVIYGGTQLTVPQQQFVAALAREVVESGEFVLVTGGFRVFQDRPAGISTDWAAASAAHAWLEAKGVAVQNQLQTWVPDPAFDRRGEQVRRFELGSVKRFRGVSDRVRRFEIVQGADVIVTISGEGNTGMVLDLAEVLRTPALPLPFTGGDSQVFWRQNRRAVQERFRMDDETADALESFDPAGAGEQGQQDLARRIVRHVLPQGVRSHGCLVLMPFRHHLRTFYEDLMRPAIEQAGFDPIRIDFSVEPGDIYDQFVRLLERSEAFIVDVTDGNPNVMYELGHAHARRIDPLLIHRGSLSDSATKQLPFYLLQQKVESVDLEQPADRERFARRIREFLAGVRAREWRR